jgi:hypothetical protein
VTESLDTRISELEAAAARLRSGQAADDDAAALVERCAALATEIASELDGLARAARQDSADPDTPEQERLL